MHISPVLFQIPCIHTAAHASRSSAAASVLLCWMLLVSGQWTMTWFGSFQVSKNARNYRSCIPVTFKRERRQIWFIMFWWSLSTDPLLPWHCGSMVDRVVHQWKDFLRRMGHFLWVEHKRGTALVHVFLYVLVMQITISYSNYRCKQTRIRLWVNLASQGSSERENCWMVSGRKIR